MDTQGKHSESRPIPGRPVIIGEVLFDCFDDGREILGGAPFNVAWHLQAFGLDPLLISRVGKDQHAGRILQAMASWGMDCTGIQQDGLYPTGQVQISMQGHQHRFEILPDQAYDRIDAEQALSILAAEQVALLYSGSLIERNPASRNAVAALRQRNFPHYVDVNLRQPWWQREDVLRLLQGVRWAKLNEEELLELGFSGETRMAAQQMREQFGFELLIITLGESGALLCSETGLIEGEPVPVRHLVDTVGAGDAFSAVTILGLLRGWKKELMLPRALAFAASQCEVQGAIRQDRDFYRQWLARWEESL